jgi:hypothetical protein
MTDTTPNLALPEIAAAQAQKHVTHNEALRVLDAVVHLAVLDRDLVAPPDTPAEGERWLVGSPASGGWAGHDDEIAAWQDGGWQFYAPHVGWLAYVLDEEALIAWSGSAWAPALDLLGGATELQNMALLGVGTTADATNPLSAKLNNVLWAARTAAEGGDGDLRYKMSKEAETNTLSLLFQDNFSGRAEIGLTGDDDFHFKVSDDGTTWRDAIVIDKSTGEVSFPQGGNSSDLEPTLAGLALGVADALNTAQFLGASGNLVADSFDALTFVDVAGATNLDAGTAGILKATFSPLSGGTAIGDMTSAGGLAAAFDASTSQSNAASAVKTSATDAYVGKNFSGSPKRIKAVTVYGANNQGFVASSNPNVTLTLRGKNGGAPASLSDGTSLGSVTFADTADESGGRTITSSDPTTAWDYIWVGITHDGAAQSMYCAELAMASAAPNDLVVSSTALAAAAVPSGAKIVVQAREIDSLTLDADLVCSASRDGGTTWSAFDMTRRFTANGISHLASAPLDISGQPSGTSMKWKIATANSKAVEIRGVCFSWS